MKITGAIFDMDGTLVDSLMLWDILWEEFGAKYKVRAYAVLEDGTYVYSDIHEYSVYDICDNLYIQK